jgi:hypothetical protein
MQVVPKFSKGVNSIVGVLALMSILGCGASSTRPAITPPTTPAPGLTPTPSAAPTPTPTPSPTPAAVPGPVVLVLEENHGYSSVIGNSAMPYLNTLASQYALATQYYADTHPSIGNYFMLTTGQILTNDDSYMGTVTADNIVRHLVSAGKTWKSYAEDLPSVGYTGGNTAGYLEHHNPFSYFSDVRSNSTQAQNLVPFTQFQSDLNNGKLPGFSFVVPNVNNDAHDGTWSAADNWLQVNIAPVLSSSQFQKSGLLIVVFDEGEATDTSHGGGQVALVIAGPSAKTNFQSSTLYQHENLLNLIANYMGIDGNLGSAASAKPMTEFLK